MNDPLPLRADDEGLLSILSTRPIEDRLVELRASCGHDGVRYERLRQLVDLAYERDHGVPLRAAADDRPERAADVGPYRLHERIGAGAFGRVHRAEHVVTGGAVAVKLLTGPAAERDGASRLVEEARLLGRLRHPAIATVHDAGVTERDGQVVPWLAMELVSGGRPITAMGALPTGRGREAALRRRLSILATVADAVAAAHAFGIVHRDIKPSNVLLTASDAPMLVDFGVALAVEGSGTHAGEGATPGSHAERRGRVGGGDTDERPTEEMEDGRSGDRRRRRAAVAGTLPYLPPECLGARDAGELDARPELQDVFALGVLAHELIDGRLPWRTPEGRPCVRAREVEEAITSGRMARLDGADARVPADVAWLLRRAMATRPADRPASAATFRDELRRLAESRPLAASEYPGGWTYRAATGARRHRAAVSVLAAVLLVLSVSTAVSTMAAERARTAERRANELLVFLDDALVAMTRSGEAGSVEELVRTLSDRAEFDARRSQLHELDVRGLVGLTAAALGEPETAARQLDAAIDLARRNDPDRLATLLLRRSTLALQQGDLERARRLADEVRSFAGSEIERLQADALDAELLVRQEDPAAITEWERIARRRARLLGRDADETLVARFNHAVALDIAGRSREAIAIMQDVVAINRDVKGPLHPDTLASGQGLAMALGSAGRYEEAFAEYEALLVSARRVLPPRHPVVVTLEMNYGVDLIHAARPEAAEQCRRALSAARAAFDADSTTVATAQFNLARALEDSDAPVAEVRRHAEAALLIQRERLPAGHFELQATRRLLARISANEGRYEEAATMLEAIAADLAAMPVPDRLRAAWVGFDLSQVLARLGRCDEAADRVREALDGFRATAGEEHDLWPRLQLFESVVLAECGDGPAAVEIALAAVDEARRRGGLESIHAAIERLREPLLRDGATELLMMLDTAVAP